MIKTLELCAQMGWPEAFMIVGVSLAVALAVGAVFWSLK